MIYPIVDLLLGMVLVWVFGFNLTKSIQCLERDALRDAMVYRVLAYLSLILAVYCISVFLNHI